MKFTIVTTDGRARLHCRGIDAGEATGAEVEFWQKIEGLEAMNKRLQSRVAELEKILIETLKNVLAISKG